MNNDTAQLVPFNYEDAQVRVVMINTEPWFVLADLCKVLGLARGAAQVAERLDDGVRQAYPITDSLGRTQQAIIVSESGMYEVVIRSDKPEAAAFRRWITGEVLPTIRRTGGYGRTVAELPDRKALARMVIEAEEARELAEARLAELEPKAQVAAKLLDAEGDLSVRDAAQALTRAGVKTGQQRLFSELASRRWISRAGDGRWRVLQYAIDHGFMSVLPQSHYHPKTGELVLDPPQPRVTPKGLQRLLSDLSPGGAS
ncbi:phage antirepressor [Nocardia farcinica]|uniref:phage antirepressor n=1 Tax=Nocardia farcinica TaxID=37329 RepID=UPI0024556A2E|nr:phage antirepressor [Nocardia farcinica]